MQGQTQDHRRDRRPGGDREDTLASELARAGAATFTSALGAAHTRGLTRKGTSASAFGLYDRGLLRPGMAADITLFDPATVKCGHETVVHEFPGGAWRIKELAEGIFGTVVNGEVLYQEGRYTGALPGKVLRNSHYEQNHRENA